LFVATKYLPCPHDPRPDPARRWRRCLYLIRHRRWPHPTRDDDATRECLRYLYDLRACREAADHRQLARRHPAVAAAHRFFTHAQPLRRAEVEARPLAGQTDEAIAACCGLPADAVAAYHALFFDVRDNLEANLFIFSLVLDPEVDIRLTGDDQEVLLKLLGYSHGPPMIDVALRYFRDPPSLSACLDGLDGPARDDLHQRLQLRRLIQTLVAPSPGLAPLETPPNAAVPSVPGVEEEPIAAPTAGEPVPPTDLPSPDQAVVAFLCEQMNALPEAPERDEAD
jgi:hypothetical protein